jgi:hypothetical protein
VALNTTITINVSTYGAVINDGVDDIHGITDALNAAKAISAAASPVKVAFEEGTYDLFPPTGNTHTISIKDAKYLHLEGNGAEILLHNPEVGFMGLTNCENVIISELYIDYAKLPFTQGRVIATHPESKTFDLEIDKGFPLLSETYFADASQRWGMLKEASGQLKKGVTNLFPYRGWTHLSGNVFRVEQPNSSYIDQIEVGDYFVQIARNNGKTIFRSNNGKNITYINITSYASPAGTYNTFNHREWNIINCRILPKPGRVHSANADCIHISGGYIGPWVEGCRFEAFSDDAVNMKYTRREILSVESPTVLTVKYNVAVGDTLCFYNPRDGILLGKVAVTGSIHTGNNVYRITLSEPVNITTISEHQLGDKAYIDTRACESFVYRNDTIRNGRRYGLALQNCYGVIENCLIENMSGCGIRIENFVDWGEGFTAHDVEISNNRFINCGFDKGFITDPTAGSISTSVARLGSPCDVTKTWCGTETADWQGIRNIRIKGNYFEYNKAALNLRNISGGEIINNGINHNPGDISLQPGEEHEYILVNNCSGIIQSENVGIMPLKKISSEQKLTILSGDRQLSIYLDELHFSKSTLSVFDCSGKIIYTQGIRQPSVTLPGLRPGMYILRVEGASRFTTQKMMVY